MLPSYVLDRIFSNLPLKNQISLALFAARLQDNGTSPLRSTDVTETAACRVFSVEAKVQGSGIKAFWDQTLVERMTKQPLDFTYNLRAALFLNKLDPDPKQILEPGLHPTVLQGLLPHMTQNERKAYLTQTLAEIRRRMDNKITASEHEKIRMLALQMDVVAESNQDFDPLFELLCEKMKIGEETRDDARKLMSLLCDIFCTLADRWTLDQVKELQILFYFTGDDDRDAETVTRLYSARQLFNQKFNPQVEEITFDDLLGLIVRQKWGAGPTIPEQVMDLHDAVRAFNSKIQKWDKEKNKDSIQSMVEDIQKVLDTHTQGGELLFCCAAALNSGLSVILDIWTEEQINLIKSTVIQILNKDTTEWMLVINILTNLSPGFTPSEHELFRSKILRALGNPDYEEMFSSLMECISRIANDRDENEMRVWSNLLRENVYKVMGFTSENAMDIDPEDLDTLHLDRYNTDPYDLNISYAAAKAIGECATKWPEECLSDLVFALVDAFTHKHHKLTANLGRSLALLALRSSDHIPSVLWLLTKALSTTCEDKSMLVSGIEMLIPSLNDDQRKDLFKTLVASKNDLVTPLILKLSMYADTDSPKVVQFVKTTYEAACARVQNTPSVTPNINANSSATSLSAS